MHKRIKTYLFLFIFAFYCNLPLTGLYSADSTHVNKHKHSAWANIVNDLQISVNDAGHYFTAPIHFSGRQWLYTAGLFAGTCAIMTGDKEIKKRISRNSNTDYTHDFWDGPTAYGNPVFATAFGGLVYTTGLFSEKENIRITGRLILESIVFSGIVTEALKVVLGRTRPFYTNTQWDFKGFKTADSLNSFPSLHTTVAFAVSTIMAERIGTWWSRILFYGAASLTAYARVLNNQHWFSDTVFGGLIGLGTGLFVLNQENQRKKALSNPKSGGRLSLYPLFNGLSAVYTLH